VKAGAKATGRDMAAVLADLALERSHRRTGGLGAAGHHEID
jgi:hypothetical protein